MKHRVSKSFLLSSCCLALTLAVAGCDNSIGVNNVIMRADSDGSFELVGGGCVLVSEVEGIGAGGGGGGPEYAKEMATQQGEIVYRYFIAPQGSAIAEVTSANGELAAEIEADMEFFASGETKHVAFETYDGVAFEVYLWGEPDCEGDLPDGPPPAE